MTKQDHIDKIRKACIAANPSILDLKFGCEVKFFNSLNGFQKKICFKYESGTMYYFTENSKKIKESVGEIGDFEILGREIQLADVLKVLPKHTYFLDTQGGWWKWNKSGVEPEYLKADWNLLLPLELQELPVLEFISNLV
jgi:hypothetical protein